MVRATWNGTVLAESDDTVVVEGNHYFPIESVDPSVLQKSAKTTVCPWKGRASYYSIVADGAVNADAAWYYPDPLPKARKIEGRVAFWKGVKVSATHDA
jgi:uncharacterized protein (DUF427 family)